MEKAQSIKMLGIGELLKQSFETYKQGFWKYIGLMIISYIAALPLVLLDNYTDKAIAGIGLLAYWSFWLLAALLAIIVGVVAETGLYILIVNISKDPDIKEILLEAKKYAFKFIIISLLIVFFVLLWSLLLIIPGIIAGIFFSLALWAYINEGYTGKAALARSKELIKGNWWAVFGRYVFINLLFSLTLFVMGLIFSFTEKAVIYWAVLSQIISFVATPFFLIYIYKIYVNLAIMKGESDIKDKERGGSINIFK